MKIVHIMIQICSIAAFAAVCYLLPPRIAYLILLLLLIRIFFFLRRQKERKLNILKSRGKPCL